MRILFMGTPEFAVASLRRLVEAGHEVCGVFTQPDKPKNRGHKLIPTPVKEYALTENIPVFQPEKLRDGTALELVNPVIVDQKGEQTGLEGCLSVPGKWGIVTRPDVVRVRAQDRDGAWFEVEGEGLTARAFCHEIEHLDGHLFVEHVDHFLSDEELQAYLEQEEREAADAQERE